MEVIFMLNHLNSTSLYTPVPQLWPEEYRLHHIIISVSINEQMQQYLSPQLVSSPLSGYRQKRTKQKSFYTN